MALKAGNLIVMGEEARQVARAIKMIAIASSDAGMDLAQLPGLSAGAQAEVDAVAVARVTGLGAANTGVKVLQEIVKNSTPLIKKDIDAPEFLSDGKTPNPDFGRFTEIDENGDDVIDVGTGEPRVIIVPSAL